MGAEDLLFNWYHVLILSDCFQIDKLFLFAHFFRYILYIRSFSLSFSRESHGSRCVIRKLYTTDVYHKKAIDRRRRRRRKPTESSEFGDIRAPTSAVHTNALIKSSGNISSAHQQTISSKTYWKEGGKKPPKYPVREGETFNNWVHIISTVDEKQREMYESSRHRLLERDGRELITISCRAHTDGV